MINFAVITAKKVTQSNTGINCPDNHNIKKKKTSGVDFDYDKKVLPNLEL